MNLKLFTIALAAAGSATYLYRRRQGRRPAVDIPLEPAYDADAMRAGLDPSILGDDSPNAAERLRADGPAAANADDHLFESSSQKGELAVAPGLPDLTRGA